MKRRSFFRSLAFLALAPKALAEAIERLPSLNVVPTFGYNPEDFFREFRLVTEQLPADIYKRVSARSPFMDLIQNGTFQTGMGDVTRSVK
jgi:hypothetical protein